MTRAFEKEVRDETMMGKVSESSELRDNKKNRSVVIVVLDAEVA